MPISGSWRNPILINTIGHAAGVLLFGLIIGLLTRDWRTHGIRRTKLSMTAAVLAFGWNAGSLIVLAARDPALIESVATMSFSMLSLLPAVLLQVAVHGRQRVVVAAGYIVSAIAVGLHFCEPFSANTDLHQAALVSIAVGFGILTLAAVLLGQKREQGAPLQKSEAISLGCLLLFTTSFLHFGYQHFRSPWTAEIAWHHIGIPVVLIVLLGDYRFLLLDTFIRFLVNSTLAAVYIAAVLVLNQKLRLWDLIAPSMFLTGIALVLLCLLLISFGYLRNSLQAWVNGFIFRRQNVDDRIMAIATLASPNRSEEELLARAARQIADHLGAERFAIVTKPADPSGPSRPSVLFGEYERERFPDQDFHAEAQLPLRFSSGDARWLILGARPGGRRYRGDDLDDMRRLGAAVVEQIERFRAEELRRLVNQAELRALQAQINPHFLFNALNTLYGIIDRRSRDARRMVINLAEIFRYFLRGHRTLIPLSEELRIVEAYLEIEALRLGDRLETELMISDPVKSTLIPILSIQPLVENAVKHGIAPKRGRGRVSVRAERVQAGLRIAVQDTGVGFGRGQMVSRDGTGLGLANVRRRLVLCYGPTAELHIQSSEAATTVSFVIPDLSCADTAAGELETERDPLMT